MKSMGQRKVKEKTMSVLQVKTIQDPVTPVQQYIDAKRGLTGGRYGRDARVQ